MSVVLGLGCDRGASAETIGSAVERALASEGLSPADVQAVASIDKKSDEAGLLALCEKYGWPCHWYAAEELRQVTVPNPSAVVLKYMGTPSVGEAAALLLANGEIDDLLVEKYKYKGHDGKNATVSVARVKDE